MSLSTSLLNSWGERLMPRTIHSHDREETRLSADWSLTLRAIVSLDLDTIAKTAFEFEHNGNTHFADELRHFYEEFRAIRITPAFADWLRTSILGKPRET